MWVEDLAVVRALLALQRMATPRQRFTADTRSVDTACSPKYQALVEHLLNFAHRAALQKQAGSDSGGGAGRRSGDDGTSAGGASSEGRGADGGDGAPPACVFHGIVFARTRASVLALTQLLRQCADLDFLTVRWRVCLFAVAAVVWGGGAQRRGACLASSLGQLHV